MLTKKPWWTQNTTPTRVIGLDPAQSFGWAWLEPKVGPRIDQSGTWKLKVSDKVKASPGGYKFSQAYKLISDLISPDGKTVLYYERARSHRGTAAAHAAGGYYAMIQAVGYDNCIPTHAVGVTELKKFATDSGTAKKPDMIAAANREWGGDYGVLSGNEDDRADALWVAAWGLEQIKQSSL